MTKHATPLTTDCACAAGRSPDGRLWAAGETWKWRIELQTDGPAPAVPAGVEKVAGDFGFVEGPVGNDVRQAGNRHPGPGPYFVAANAHPRISLVLRHLTPRSQVFRSPTEKGGCDARQQRHIVA